MKNIVILAGIAAMLFAAGPNNPANFDTAKARMSENAAKKVQIATGFKECVDKATDVSMLLLHR